MKDGQVVHVFDGWDRNRYYMCTDGTIANEGSAGAEYTFYSYYNFKNGELQIVESVFSDIDENSESHWYQSDKEAYEDESNEITLEEAADAIDKHTYKQISYTYFN